MRNQKGNTHIIRTGGDQPLRRGFDTKKPSVNIMFDLRHIIKDGKEFGFIEFIIEEKNKIYEGEPEHRFQIGYEDVALLHHAVTQALIFVSTVGIGEDDVY